MILARVSFDITGFHSVGSRSVLESCMSVGIRIGSEDVTEARVGVIGATIIRGDIGGEDGGVLGADIGE
jgi:hypothetical protein